MIQSAIHIRKSFQSGSEASGEDSDGMSSCSENCWEAMSAGRLALEEYRYHLLVNEGN